MANLSHRRGSHYQEPPGWASRVRGALLWIACGDALGARFEGQRRVDLREVNKLMTSPPALLSWTDDTALTLALAEHLAHHHGEVNQDELANQLAAEWLHDPHRGYGTGATQLFQRILSNEPWQRAAPALFDGQSSAGNGAAMRVAPVGLLAAPNLAQAAELARQQAAVTHHHPHGQDGAVVQAVAVALAATSAPNDPVDARRFIAGLLTHIPAESGFATVLPALTGVVQHARNPLDVAAILGNDVTALGSVPAAIAYFLLHPDSPQEALRWAICGAGDTDTIAVMVGALIGARHGEATLPAHWLPRLEDTERINRAGTALASAKRNSP